MDDAVLMEELHAFGNLLCPLHSMLSELLDVFVCNTKSRVSRSMDENTQSADGVI